MRKRLCKLHKELGLKEMGNAPDTKSVIKKVNITIDAERAEKNVFAKRKFAHAALVAILILSVASFASIAATMGWHHKLIEYFNNPTAKQMELMDGAFDTPMVSGTDNGYTVNVLNTLADKHGIYVLYELVLPPEKELSVATADAFMKDIHHMVLVEQKGYSNNDNTLLGGIGKHKILAVEKNKIIVCEYNGLGGEITDEYKVSLTVGNMKYIDNSEKFGNTGVFNIENAELVGDFHIHLMWNFRYEDKGKSIAVNKKLCINNVNENTLNRIDISPMSIWIMAEGDAIPTSMCPIVRFKDGTELTYDSRDENAYAMFSNYQTGDNSKGHSVLGYVFDTIIDIQTIESITIGDQVIQVN